MTGLFTTTGIAALLAITASLVLASLVTTLAFWRQPENRLAQAIVFVFLAAHFASAAMQYLFLPAEDLNPLRAWQEAFQMLEEEPEKGVPSCGPA